MAGNYEYFDDIFDDDIDSPPIKKEGRKKSKFPVMIASLIVIASLIGGGWYAVKKNIVPLPQSSQEQTDDGLDPNRERTDEQLQLVNTQQVYWADGICNVTSEWSNSKFPGSINIDGKATVMKNKKAISDSLAADAKELRKRSGTLPSLIEDAYTKALEYQESSTTITDHNKIVTEVDPSVVEATNRLKEGINRYAGSLESMSRDLSSYADYDEYGTRAAITRVQKGLDKAYQEFGFALTGVFDEGLFENAVTLKAVSELESCSGALIDDNELNSRYGDELQKQETIEEFIDYKKCQVFIDNSNRVTNRNESYNDSVNECNTLLSTITVDNDHDGNYMNIDTQDNFRARPSHDVADETQEDPQEETENNV